MKSAVILLVLATIVTGPGWLGAQEVPTYSDLSRPLELAPAGGADRERIGRLYSANGFGSPGEAETVWWAGKLASGLTDEQLSLAVLGGGSEVVDTLTQQLRSEYLDAFGPPPPPERDAAGAGEPAADPADAEPDERQTPETSPAAAVDAKRGDGESGPGWVSRTASSVKSWGARKGKDALAGFSRLPDPVRRFAGRGVDRALSGAAWVGDLFDGAAETLAGSVTGREEEGRWIPYQNGVPFPSFERQAVRQTLDLAGEWRFERTRADHALSLSLRTRATLARLEAEGGGRHSARFDDSGWERRQVPCSDNAMRGPMGRPESYEDGSWWRRTVDVPLGWRGRYVRFVCYGANYTADVWVNGKHAGAHEGGYTSWTLDVSRLLRPGRKNSIAIRLDNIPWQSTNAILPYARADWHNFGGLYRDLYLEACAPVSIQNAYVRSARPDGSLVVDLVVFNRRPTPQRVQLVVAVKRAMVSETAPSLLTLDAAQLAGPEVARADASVDVPGGQARMVRVPMDVPQARAWSPGMPNLYVLQADSRSAAGDTDTLSTQFGFRTIEVDREAPRLLANGEPAPALAGVARHEDHPESGRALPSRQVKDDLLLIRDRLRANFLRTAHYPNHPLTYLLTDRLGLVAWEEIPFYWVNDARAYRVLARRGLPLAMWREMVLRDYNRPSIWFWSAANECGPIGARRKHIKTLREDLRERYDDGRLVTQSAAADYPGPFDQTMAECDVVAWTLYFGIGFEARDRFKKDLSQTLAGTREFLEKAHKYFPDKPVIASEFGYWATPEGGLAPDQLKFFEEAMKAFEERSTMDRRGTPRKRGFVAGWAWWAAFDYFTVHTGVSTFGAFQADRQTTRPVLEAMANRYGAYSGWRGE